MIDEAVAELIRKLTTSDRKNRVNALRELGRLQVKPAIEPISDFLSTEPERNEMLLALKMLGHIGDRQAVPILLRYFDVAQPTVMNALIELGIFDHVLPANRRLRHHIKIALRVADPELKYLIEQDQLTTDTMRSVLPPIL